MRRLLFAAVVAACLAFPASAPATFAGANGRIAYDAFPPGATEPLVGTVNPDGSDPRLLDNGGEAQFSPSGQQIAYTLSSDGGGFALMNADGTNQRDLFSAGQGFANPSHPSWFPGTDGPSLGLQSGSGEWVIWDYVRFQMTHTGVTGVAFPLLSPNGAEVAFERGGDLWLMNTDGSDQRVIAEGGRNADFAPSGFEVVFVRGEPGALDLFVVNLLTGEERQITSAPGNDTSPVWSPDGTLIAYERAGDIWLTKPDGTGKRQITFTPTSESPTDWQALPTTPPDCDAVQASPKTLWPPNNKLRTVRLLHPEGTTIDPEEVRLRAKKGAVYHVSFTLTDAQGATCGRTLTIRVKKPKRK